MALFIVVSLRGSALRSRSRDKILLDLLGIALGVVFAYPYLYPRLGPLATLLVGSPLLARS